MGFDYNLIELRMQSLRNFESERLAAAVYNEIWSSGESFIPKRFDVDQLLEGVVKDDNFSELVKLWMNSENNLLIDDYSCGHLFAEKSGVYSVDYLMSWEKAMFTILTLFQWQLL